MNNPGIASGFAVGLSMVEGLVFRPNKPFRACLICGDVFQSEEDRSDDPAGAVLRQEWANRHAKQHSERDHMLLAISGNTMTPEAAHRLAAFGVIPVGDMILSPEHTVALRESSPIPIKDAEG